MTTPRFPTWHTPGTQGQESGTPQSQLVQDRQAQKISLCLISYIIYPENFKVLLTLMYLVSVAAESKVGLLFKGLRLFGDLVCHLFLAPRARYAKVIVPTPETAPRPSQIPFHRHTAATAQSNSMAVLA